METHINLMKRLLVLACAATALATRGSAQSTPDDTPVPSEKIIREWLQNEDPRFMAWGAHDAMVQGKTNLVPDLLLLAGRWETQRPSIPGSDGQGLYLTQKEQRQRDAMAAVVDALVQMKADVPGDTLKRLTPNFGNAVAVLLGRKPVDEAVQLALEFYRAEDNGAYGLKNVSAAILALHPPSGFAGELLAGTTVKATVFVVMPGLGGMGTGGSGSCGLAGSMPNEGWPETGMYVLSRNKGDDSVLLVGGVDPVYAERVLTTRFNGDPCTALRPANQVDLIAEILGQPPDAIKWKTEVVKSIEYESAERFNQALMTFVQEQQAMYRGTAEAMETRGLIQRSEVMQSLPLLQLELDDMRGPEAEPIAKEEINLPVRVVWAKQ
jgi:hypothetical protein